MEMVNRSTEKVSLPLLKTGNSKVPNNILPFFLMLRVAEQLYTLIFLDNFQ